MALTMVQTVLSCMHQSIGRYITAACLIIEEIEDRQCRFFREQPAH